LLVGCSKPAPSEKLGSETKPLPSTNTAEPWFEDVGAGANVTFVMQLGHREGRYLMPEVKGGGVGVLDYDGDGLLDIFCVQAGSLYPDVTNRPTHKLYHNLGDWKFQDVTEAAHVAGNGCYGMGCAAGDYNNDGRIDLYVTALGTNALYRNNGDGTFTDVSLQAGVGGNGAWGMSAAFFDYDLDGHPDLVVANYIRWSREIEVECYSRGGLPDYCSPLNYNAPSMGTLYHNRGDGTFENVTLAAGLDKAYGYGLGVICADFNQDGWPDIFMANDATPNQLWINQRDGTFKDEALIRGCAVNGMGMSEAGMGIAVVDIFERGVFDLFVTHLAGEANRLFHNTGNGYFEDLVTPKGPGAISWPYTSFGVGFFDFDNDGILDAYVANGRVKRGVTDFDPADPYAEPNNVLRGLGAGDFEEVFPQGGTNPTLIAASRGAAFGDLDNDGGIDIVVTNRDRPVHLLRNVVGRHGHWIMFRVLNRAGSDAVGAVACLEAAGKRHWRQVQPNQSYCSTNDPRLHFGLGKAQRVDRITIRWPRGEEESFGPFEADRLYEVRERATSPPARPGPHARVQGLAPRRAEG
jgi:hypothetical protein